MGGRRGGGGGGGERRVIRVSGCYLACLARFDGDVRAPVLISCGVLPRARRLGRRPDLTPCSGGVPGCVGSGTWSSRRALLHAFHCLAMLLPRLLL